MYDYMLGGGNNFAADREMVDKVTAVAPMAGQLALLNRAFLRRAVLTLVDSGIRQFLDLGSGIPTVGNVHEIAQQADPEARIVYVDNEPVAVAHSEVMLEDNDRATAILADIRDPSGILNHPKTQQILDFDAPIGLLMITILHYIADSDGPLELMAAYRDALTSGSYLALSHLTVDVETAEVAEMVNLLKNGPNPLYPRTREEIASLFTGFELLEPGLVATAQWRPRSAGDAGNGSTGDPLLAGVAVKR